MAPSPVCYLLAGLTVGCTAAQFSAVVNDEQTVIGHWGSMEWWISFLGSALQDVVSVHYSLLCIMEEQETGQTRGTDCCMCHSTDKVQLHVTDIKQTPA